MDKKKEKRRTREQRKKRTNTREQGDKITKYCNKVTLGALAPHLTVSPREQKGIRTRRQDNLACKIAPKAGPMQGTSVDDKETKGQEDNINKVQENKRARGQYNKRSKRTRTNITRGQEKRRTL